MLWDTNSIIFFLQDLLPSPSKAFLLKELNLRKPQISIITEIELLSWPKISRVEIGNISEFLSNFESIGLTEEIKIVTIQLRKSTGLKIPDAVIAATAITQAVPLLTNNLKDFEKVDFLKILDPMNLG
jgi:predicted nucleic acid-binding protein